MKTQQLGWMIVLIGSSLMVTALLLTPNFNAYASEPIDTAHSRLAVNEARPKELRQTADITFTPAYTAYLPFIRNFYPAPPAGIYGRVTYQGTPLTDAQVQLRRCDNLGVYWECLSSHTQYTMTDETGHYQFTTAASLENTQKYFVLFHSADPRYLWNWQSFSIYSYTAGQTVAGGDFDVADVALVAPDNAITTTLPISFQWAVRPATPVDGYQLLLINNTTGYVWLSEQLGHVSDHTLSSPPPDYGPGVKYEWQIQVTSPDGGSGYSQQHRTFTVAGGTR